MCVCVLCERVCVCVPVRLSGGLPLSVSVCPSVYVSVIVAVLAFAAPAAALPSRLLSDPGHKTSMMIMTNLAVAITTGLAPESSYACHTRQKRKGNGGGGGGKRGRWGGGVGAEGGGGPDRGRTAGHWVQPRGGEGRVGRSGTQRKTPPDNLAT